MNAEDVIESHPLRLLEGDKAIPKGEISLLLARSGVGKSAALINFALNEILQGNHVLHFSAGMASEKTHHYYQKIFNDYTKHHPEVPNGSWEEVYHHFTVVSYLDAGKMIEDLDTEIDTIISSTQVRPTLIVVDGLDFPEEADRKHLAAMEAVARKYNVKLLASLRIHRKMAGEVDLEGPFNQAKAFSSHIYFLEPDPERDRINLELINASGKELLAVSFCPHDFIFRSS